MRVLTLFAALALLLMRDVPAQAGGTDLTDLSIEELLAVEVTSVAKKRQRVGDAAAAVFVISQADIRRSGATRITDLLRMVPGVQVGEVDSNSVAVSARGFNERFSNKLLVLVDGRAVYRSVVSGVLWDQILVPLQEIERIEVVRGPGATLWGANAVNGVINIITKHPIDSQGAMVSAHVGTNDLAGFHGRWGGVLGEDAAYRFYLRGDARKGLVDDGGSPVNDRQTALQGGFRFDWEPNRRDAFTIQGDAQTGRLQSRIDQSGQSLFSFLPLEDSDERFSGLNLLARWARGNTGQGDFNLQGYLDHLTRSEFDSSLSSTIVGLDFQHSLPALGRHEVVWGINYLMTRDDAAGDFVNFGNGGQFHHLSGVFLQDDIALLPDELSLTLGTKLEYNTFTGFEVQPSARLFWRPAPDFAVWGAVSRAVRTPARFETSLDLASETIPAGTPPNIGPFPLTIEILGEPDLDAETLHAFEVGTRFSPLPNLAFDIAGYYNRYDDLIVLDDLAPSPGPSGVVQSVIFRNGGKAASLGAEVSAEWGVTDTWSLKGAYGYQRIDFRGDDDSRSEERFEGLTPRHQFSLRSQYDVTPDIEFDLWLRAQGELTESDTRGFADLDARISWRPRPELELSVTGRNLLRARHRDFAQREYPTLGGNVERSVFGQIELRF